MSQVNAVSVLTKILQTREEEEVGQHKGCTFKARLADAAKPARNVDKRSYIFDINGWYLCQADGLESQIAYICTSQEMHINKENG